MLSLVEYAIEELRTGQLYRVKVPRSFKLGGIHVIGGNAYLQGTQFSEDPVEFFTQLGKDHKEYVILFACVGNHVRVKWSDTLPSGEENLSEKEALIRRYDVLLAEQLDLPENLEMSRDFFKQEVKQIIVCLGEVCDLYAFILRVNGDTRNKELEQKLLEQDKTISAALQEVRDLMRLDALKSIADRPVQ